MFKKTILILVLVFSLVFGATYVTREYQGMTELETYINSLGYDIDYMIGLNGFQGSYIVLSKAGGTGGSMDIDSLITDTLRINTTTAAPTAVSASTANIIVTVNVQGTNYHLLLREI